MYVCTYINSPNVCSCIVVKRVINISLQDKQYSLKERTMLVVFLVHSFNSLVCVCVRNWYCINA